MRISMTKLLMMSVALGLLFTSSRADNLVTLTPLEQTGLELRYGSTMAWADESKLDLDQGEKKGVSTGRKSPGKAFALSLLVPGLGQYYNGSRIKPFVFLGVEVTAWAMYFKWHGDYEDITTSFENFQRAHWSRVSYADYLEAAYQGRGGEYRDDDSITAVEISHHLPDTETGQYFEMTGKYNQFAWGWDDATRNGYTLETWTDSADLAIIDQAHTPISARREAYLQMRKDANDKYDQAERMIIVSIVNHLISGFEAYIGAKRHNKQVGGGDSEFSSIGLEASVRSLSLPNDTPYLTATVRF